MPIVADAAYDMASQPYAMRAADVDILFRRRHRSCHTLLRHADAFIVAPGVRSLFTLSATHAYVLYAIAVTRHDAALRCRQHASV